MMTAHPRVLVTYPPSPQDATLINIARAAICHYHAADGTFRKVLPADRARREVAGQQAVAGLLPVPRLLDVREAEDGCEIVYEYGARGETRPVADGNVSRLRARGRFPCPLHRRGHAAACPRSVQRRREHR